MPKYLFIIHDEGNDNRITGTTLRNDSFEVNPTLYKETESVDFFKTVQRLLENNEIRYPKDHSGELKIEDLNQTKVDTLQMKKVHTIERGMQLINLRINVVSLFGFAKFIMLNNYLIDAGFVITDENREEKYLEVINANDPNLISKLEEYLEVKDSVSQDLFWYNHFQDFQNTIESASNEEEIDKAFNAFNSLFY